jgi:site-specific DNA recombinase
MTRCGKCGGPVVSVSRPHQGGRQQVYKCQVHGCVVVQLDLLDAYVERVIVAWLSREDVYAQLVKASADTDKKAAGARAEAEKLKADLEQWRQAAAALQVTAQAFGPVERSLLDAIADAEQRATDAAIPPLLRGLIGPDAAEKWSRMQTAAKRDVIRIITEISIAHAGSGTRIPLSQRVQFGGLMGSLTEPAKSAAAGQELAS